MGRNACCVIMGVALIMQAGLMVGCGGRGAGEITMEQARAVVDVYLKARNEASLKLLDGIYSPGVIVHDPSQPGPIAGLEALKAQYGNTHAAVPDVKFSLDDLYVKGDRLAWVFTMSGTFTKTFRTPLGEVPPTGKPIRFSGVSIDRLADGKIAEEWVYFNVLEILGPLGFEVVPPGAPGNAQPGLVKAVAWDDLPERIALGGVELRFAQMGDMLLTFYRLPMGTNFAVLFKGLPDDMCPSRHWAYFLKGKFLIRTKSGEVTVKPGQAFYVPPGHMPEVLEDSEFVEFSPAAEFRPVVEHALRLAKARRGE